jgi:hypothetical protein
MSSLPEAETRLSISRRNLAPISVAKVPAGGEFTFSAFIIEPHQTTIVLERHLAAWTIVDGPIPVAASHSEIGLYESVAANLDNVLI